MIGCIVFTAGGQTRVRHFKHDYSMATFCHHFPRDIIQFAHEIYLNIHGIEMPKDRLGISKPGKLSTVYELAADIKELYDTDIPLYGSSHR